MTLLGLSDDSLNAALNLASRLRHLEELPTDGDVPQAISSDEARGATKTARRPGLS